MKELRTSLNCMYCGKPQPVKIAKPKPSLKSFSQFNCSFCSASMNIIASKIFGDGAPEWNFKIKLLSTGKIPQPPPIIPVEKVDHFALIVFLSLLSGLLIGLGLLF